MNGVAADLTIVCEASRYRIWIEPAGRRNKSNLILEVDPLEEKSNLRRLPFDSNYFDTVIFKQKFPLRTTLFEEGLRVLKEGGSFFWTDLKEEQVPPVKHLLLHAGLIEVGEKMFGLGGKDLLGIGGNKPVQLSRH